MEARQSQFSEASVWKYMKQGKEKFVQRKDTLGREATIVNKQATKLEVSTQFVRER